MKTVAKFSLNVGRSTTHRLLIPGGGRFLHAERTPSTMESFIDTWWLIEDASPKVEVELQTISTGNEVPENMLYLASVPIFDGTVTLHLWQKDTPFEEFVIENGQFVKKASQ